MKTKMLVLLTALLLTQVSCKDSGESKGQQGTVCLVLCDLTTSANPTHVDMMARNAAQIIGWMPHGATVFYKELDGSPHLSPFLEVTIPDDWFKNDREEARVHEKMVTDSIAIIQAIRGRKASHDSLFAKKTDESCIHASVLEGAAFLMEYPEDKYQRELVILSDMMEHCVWADGTGKVSLHSREALDRALAMPLDSSSHKLLRDIRVTVILTPTATGEAHPAAISGQDLRQFWQRQFDWLGSKGDDLHFQTTFPQERWADYRKMNPCKEE